MESHKTRGFDLLASLLIIASVAVCVADSTAVLGPLLSGGISLFTDAASVGGAACSATGHTCGNCTSAPVCIRTSANSFINAGVFNCAELDPNKPYCTSGECSNTPAAGCEVLEPESLFQCTGDGYFPDPDDCQKFHFCVGPRATSYPCSDNYVYSHEKNSCVRKKVSSDCAVIKCKYAVVIEYVVYPKDPSVYALCIRNNPTIMLKCNDGDQFDVTTAQCKFICKNEGLFSVYGECRKFHECIYKSRNKYEVVDRECPEGSRFDSDKGHCVIGTC